MGYRQQFDLSGRVALLTGGLGILGRCFAEGLAEMGAHVALSDLDGDAAAAFAADLGRRHGRPCFGTMCDVSKPDQVAQMVEASEKALGPIAILHNNAGNPPVDGERYFARFEDYDLATWREVLATDLDGMFLVAKEVIGRMAQRGGGAVVQTASIYGAFASDQRIYEGSFYNGRPINNPAVYGTGKAGVIGLTRWLAAAYAEKGVRVNALVPGGVESGQNETFLKRYSARVPMGRLAKREEVVGALLWLVSDASSYVTGQTIFVDGGLSAW